MCAEVPVWYDAGDGVLDGVGDLLLRDVGESILHVVAHGLLLAFLGKEAVVARLFLSWVLEVARAQGNVVVGGEAGRRHGGSLCLGLCWRLLVVLDGEQGVHVDACLG